MEVVQRRMRNSSVTTNGDSNESVLVVSKTVVLIIYQQALKGIQQIHHNEITAQKMLRSVRINGLGRSTAGS